MSLITESHDSLPYIDAEPSESERAKARKLITAELAPSHQRTLHPSLPSLSEPKFSDLIQKELHRHANGHAAEGGIDLSRYEAPESPSPADDFDVASWRTALRTAYTSSAYLSGRHANLALLDEFGKNAWLVGNSQLEEILKDLDRELAEVTAQTEGVNKARKAAQEGSRGEIVGLEETWRMGVGRMVEVQVAAEGLRREILERRRESVL